MAVYPSGVSNSPPEERRKKREEKRASGTSAVRRALSLSRFHALALPQHGGGNHFARAKSSRRAYGRSLVSWFGFRFQTGRKYTRAFVCIGFHHRDETDQKCACVPLKAGSLDPVICCRSERVTFPGSAMSLQSGDEARLVGISGLLSH